VGLNTDIIKSSFEELAYQADQFAEQVYADLFNQHPHLVPAFINVDETDLRQRFVRGLAVVIRLTNDEQALTTFTRQLGARHQNYRANADDFPIVAEILLNRMPQYLSAKTWTDECQQAWSELLEKIVSEMQFGIQQEDLLEAANTTEQSQSRSATTAIKKNSSQTPTTKVGKHVQPGKNTTETEIRNMATTTKAPKATEAPKTNDSNQFSSMLENIPINVLLANLDFEITYMNPASVKQLKELEHLLPIRVDEMIGAKIDVFHENPEHQRKMLSDPNNLPHRAQIAVGEE